HEGARSRFNQRSSPFDSKWAGQVHGVTGPVWIAEKLSHAEDEIAFHMLGLACRVCLVEAVDRDQGPTHMPDLVAIGVVATVKLPFEAFKCRFPSGQSP